MKVSKEDFDNLLSVCSCSSEYTNYGTILLMRNGSNLSEEEFSSQEEVVSYLDSRCGMVSKFKSDSYDSRRAEATYRFLRKEERS